MPLELRPESRRVRCSLAAVLLSVLALGLVGCESIRLIARGGSASDLDWGVTIALPVPDSNTPKSEKSLPPPEDQEIEAEEND